jgi:hypothetical protein
MFNTELRLEPEANPAANKSHTTFAPTRRRKAFICPSEKRAAVERNHMIYWRCNVASLAVFTQHRQKG